MISFKVDAYHIINTSLQEALTCAVNVYFDNRRREPVDMESREWQEDFGEVLESEFWLALEDNGLTLPDKGENDECQIGGTEATT